eukprot:PhF_6_TR9676/c0_g1_i1/m.14890
MGACHCLPQQVERELWVPVVSDNVVKFQRTHRRSTIKITSPDDKNGEDRVNEYELFPAQMTFIKEWLSRVISEDSPDDAAPDSTRIPSSPNARLMSKEEDRRTSDDYRRPSELGGLTAWRLQRLNQSYPQWSQIVAPGDGSRSVTAPNSADGEGGGGQGGGDDGQNKDAEWMYNLDDLDKEYKQRTGHTLQKHQSMRK